MIWKGEARPRREKVTLKKITHDQIHATLYILQETVNVIKDANTDL